MGSNPTIPSMEKKIIAIICENRYDFTQPIMAFPRGMVETVHVKERWFETRTKKYFRVNKPIHVCGVTFDSAIFTDNAIWNKELDDILEILRPSLKVRK